MGNAVARTLRAIAGDGQGASWNSARINQARQFLNKAARSDAKRETEHQSRKRNRRGR